MFEVLVPARSPEILTPIVGSDRVAHLVDVGRATMSNLGGRRIVSVNSTATGGGVAEMLPVLLAYVGGVDVDGRWFVLEGDPEFFTLTKRLHHRIHGEPGDGGPLGEPERELMQRTFARNEPDAARLFRPSDVVLLHDPQPAPMAKWLADRGQTVVWRCHIGVDGGNQYTQQAWDFLRPMLEPYVDRYVFTRREYAPDWVPTERLSVIKPSLDPFSAKNRELSDEYCVATLQQIGIVSGPPTVALTFERGDGSVGTVTGSAGIAREGFAPSPTTPLVVQVSRWDPLKDMAGVLSAFANEPGCADAHLVLAGPDVASVADDPEGLDVLNSVVAQWRELDEHVRARISIVCLPMDDPEANAIMVNALQRHAAVVVQKSLKEGFGLTVTEAMLKGRPVVAAAVGGIVDQIRDGVDGVLVSSTDVAQTGRAIGELLADPERANRIGEAARRSVVAQFMPDTSLLLWAESINHAGTGNGQ